MRCAWGATAKQPARLPVGGAVRGPAAGHCYCSWLLRVSRASDIAKATALDKRHMVGGSVVHSVDGAPLYYSCCRMGCL